MEYQEEKIDLNFWKDQSTEEQNHMMLCQNKRRNRTKNSS